MSLPEQKGPCEELEENWMRYEYFKKTSIENAHRNMCAMMDSEWLEEAVDTWINDNQKPGTSQESEEGSNTRKRKNEFVRNAETRKQRKIESSESPEVSPVENLAQSSESNKVETKKDDDDGTEGSHGSINSEDSVETDNTNEEKVISFNAYKQDDVWKWYNKFGKERIQSLKRNPLKCEDIPEILFIHRHCVDQKDDVYSLLLPIKKIKVTIDYGKVKIEVYIDSNSDQCSRIEYWSYEDEESTEHCLIWNEDSVRNVPNGESSVLSAEAFAILVKNPEMEFDELDFDIAPFFQGLPEKYPKMCFYEEAPIYLNKLECEEISTTKFTCTLYAETEDRTEDNKFIDEIWKLFIRNDLDTIHFRYWDVDMEVCCCDCHPHLWPSPLMIHDLFKEARYLNIKDFGFVDEWYVYSTFEIIEVAHLIEEQIKEIILRFSPDQPVLFKTHCRINVESAKEYLMANLSSPSCEKRWDGNTFTYIDGLATVVAEFEDYQFRITVTNRSPPPTEQ